MIRVLLALGLLFAASSRASSQLHLEVSAGGHDRENCPVVFVLPESLRATKQFSLVRDGDGTAVPIQRFGGRNKPKLMWMIHDKLAAGQNRRYLLEVGPQDKVDKFVRCRDDGKAVTVSVANTPVLTFRHAVVDAPEGISNVYQRSGYIHPIYTPQGNVVTGDFEPDHPHQHGLFMAWVNATFRDRPVDFWNQAKGLGDVEFASLSRLRDGPVFAQFTAKINHVAIDDEGKKTAAINEAWTLRVYHSQRPFLFELTSRQRAATVDPVTVNEYHYGGLAVRGPSSWLRPAPRGENQSASTDPLAAADFYTSSGRARVDGNETRARWVEMHGPLGSAHGGLIVLAAPRNFRAPQTVRLHPTKPYFCFAPMQLGAFSIVQPDAYVSQFRFVVHDGAQDPLLAERMWQDLAHPPTVRLLQ